MMNAEEIEQLIIEVLNPPESIKSNSKKHESLYARYAAITIMYEEGIIDREIARYLNMERSSVTNARRKVSQLLDYDKEFKQIYKKCSARRVEMEDAA